MSNNELEKYQAEYSKLVENLVAFHNANLHFCNYPDSLKALRIIRGHIRNIQNNARALKSKAKLVHDEGKINRKEAKKLTSDHNKYRSRKRKIENVNSRPTQRTV